MTLPVFQCAHVQHVRIMGGSRPLHIHIPEHQIGITNNQLIKGTAHAKIIKKSVILFRVLNMTI